MTTSLRPTDTLGPTLAANDDATTLVAESKVSRLTKRPYIQRGTPEFIRVTFAFFQPDLPLLPCSIASNRFCHCYRRILIFHLRAAVYRFQPQPGCWLLA